MSNIKSTDYVEGLVNNLEKNTETIQNDLSTLKTEVEEIKNNSVSDEQISTAVNNYMQENPVSSGATAEQAAQIQANKTAIGDSNSGLVKDVADLKTNLNTVGTILDRINGEVI